MTEPAITLSEPVQMRSGKWKVEIQVSTEPTLVYKRIADTPEDVTSLAREFMEDRLSRYFKSVARKHAQVAGRLRQARKAAVRADAGA